MNTIIPVNRKRIPVMLLLIIIFLLILLLALMNVIESDEPDKQFKIYLYIGLIMSTIYYLSISFLDYIKTLFDSKATLKMSTNGIDDNLSIFSCGNVAWKEIMGVEIVNYLKTDFLVIKVQDPDIFIQRQSKWKQRNLQSYLKKFGSPIVISQKRIKIDVVELQNIIMMNKNAVS
jgi:hypothetical protein